MSAERHNFNAKCKRRTLQASFNQSEGKANGKADLMLPAIDWREAFAKFGYVPERSGS